MLGRGAEGALVFLLSSELLQAHKGCRLRGTDDFISQVKTVVGKLLTGSLRAGSVLLSVLSSAVLCSFLLVGLHSGTKTGQSWSVGANWTPSSAHTAER